MHDISYGLPRPDLRDVVVETGRGCLGRVIVREYELNQGCEAAREETKSFGEETKSFGSYRKGPREIRTPVGRFRVCSDSRYTIGPRS